MPFHFNTSILTAPVADWGLEFPSIFRFNSSLAVLGLQCNLNHHLSSFRNMAQITLADWSCQYNHCHPALTVPNQPRSFSCLRCFIPYTWTHAHAVLQKTNTSFLSTDLSYIILGSVSLHHLNNLLPQPHRPRWVIAREIGGLAVTTVVRVLRFS